MKPRRYGPFRYVPITQRPKLTWPNGERVAFALNSKICDHQPQIVEEGVKLGWESMGHCEENMMRLNEVAADQERQLIHDTLATIVEGCTYVAEWLRDDQPFGSTEDFETMMRQQFDTLYREGAESGRVMAIARRGGAPKSPGTVIYGIRARQVHGSHARSSASSRAFAAKNTKRCAGRGADKLGKSERLRPQHAGDLMNHLSRSLSAAIALAALACMLGSAVAHAQTYPTRPVRMIIPFPPGGGADAMGRIIGQKLSEMWGQQVIFDNRAGAGGNVGTEVAARSAPDGYTLAVASTGIMAINPFLYRKVPYDPLKDFVPLAMGGNFPHIIVVHPSLPAKTAADLVKLAKEKPGELTYSSAGVGTPNHLAGELLGTMARAKLLHVPYKGTGPQILAVLSGETALTISPLPSAIPHVRTGRMRALAVTSLKRLPQVPAVPTVDESGLPGYEVIAWNAFIAPAGVPQDIVNKVNADIGRILAMPDVRERLEADGWTPRAMMPDEFGRYIRAEMTKWGKVVRESGARAD